MLKPLFQKVLVAFNGSPSSLRAVMYSIMMAKQYKCSVKVVYVVDTATIKHLTLSRVFYDDEAKDTEHSLNDDGKKNLEYAKRLARNKGIEIETELRFGSVWAEVISSADAYKADLILLGGSSESSSLTTLTHDVVKAQDAEIIGSAHCSVMVVRHQYIEQLFKIL